MKWNGPWLPLAMITALQVLFILSLIVLIIIFVFRPKRKEVFELPEGYREMLQDYVHFYVQLSNGDKLKFEERLRKFLASIRITPANAEVEDLDTVLIGAAAIIPVFRIPDWEYINLREILVYPGNFNTDFEQQGHNRHISGMVGTGALQNVMILSKWELRQGFIDRSTRQNVAIHEFVHLIDKMDGTLDGVPELLLERRNVPEWKSLMEKVMEAIRQGQTDINPYAATSNVECFPVLAEYFFENKERFCYLYPQLGTLMEKIFHRDR